MNKDMKVFIRTWGCQMNVRDSEVIIGNLTSKGYKLTESPKEANVILFNTCSVRQHAEHKVWSEIGKYKRKRTIIGLVGCMAEYHKKKAFEKAPCIDFVCGPNNIASIPSLIEEAKDDGPKGMAVSQKQRDEFVYNTNFQANGNGSFVVIVEGCNNFCSYCVVPYVRGREKSRHYGDILKETRQLIAKGIKEITLLGQNVNSYQSDSVDFSKLLKMVDELEGLSCFDFVTSHPKDASREMFEVMAKCKKLKKYLHLPLQSASDRILKLMKREYNLKEYLKKIEDYRNIVGGSLGTDIIVGFPTETEEDFQKTKQTLEEIRFDNAYIFKYSTRPHTKAAELKDDVPTKEKKRRHKILLDLQREIFKSKKI